MFFKLYLNILAPKINKEYMKNDICLLVGCGSWCQVGKRFVDVGDKGLMASKVRKWQGIVQFRFRQGVKWAKSSLTWSTRLNGLKSQKVLDEESLVWAKSLLKCWQRPNGLKRLEVTRNCRQCSNSGSDKVLSRQTVR